MTSTLHLLAFQVKDTIKPKSTVQFKDQNCRSFLNFFENSVVHDQNLDSKVKG